VDLLAGGVPVMVVGHHEGGSFFRYAVSRDDAGTWSPVVELQRFFVVLRQILTEAFFLSRV